MSEDRKYNYAVNIIVNVQRTDGEHLTDSENAMAEELHAAAEAAVTKIMRKHGQKQTKRLSKEITKY
jgi:hypothetical protein